MDQKETLQYYFILDNIFPNLEKIITWFEAAVFRYITSMFSYTAFTSNCSLELFVNIGSHVPHNLRYSFKKL